VRLPQNIPAALRDRLRPICVAVTAAEPLALFQTARKEFQENSFLEMRFDALPAPGDALPLLRQFCQAYPQAAVLANCRRIAGGGGFRGSVDEQLGLLGQMADGGAVLVDVELETLEAAEPEQLIRLRDQLTGAGAHLLVSAHDFTGTGDLDATLAKLRALGAPACPAIYKIVSTAQGLADNLRMLGFIEAASREVPVVGICMGLPGLPSRVLALRFGALFTFASASEGEATAAGQVSAKLLLEEYRAAALSSETRVYGVAGNPVAHSLSPALHNRGFRAAGIDAIYLPLHTASIEDLMALVHGLPIAGLSVTMPWKVEILPYLDEVDALASEIGAVNTVLRRADGSLYGSNTDAAAVVEPLRKRLSLGGARVLLLGAGGAARAACFALRSGGAAVHILTRTPPAAEQLARDSGAAVADRAQLGRFDVVVNATPAGMAGATQNAELLVDEATLSGVRVVFEMVYRPAETPLTRLAKALGIEVITGREMFLHQGIRQWSLWTGNDAPEAAMRDALLPERE